MLVGNQILFDSFTLPPAGSSLVMLGTIDELSRSPATFLTHTILDKLSMLKLVLPVMKEVPVAGPLTRHTPLQPHFLVVVSLGVSLDYCTD